MERAANSMLQDGFSVRKAAEVFGVHKSTLGDRVSGRVLPGTSCGAMRYLTDDKEIKLASFIIGLASIGHPKTIKEILVIVQMILLVEFIELSLMGWWEAYKRRHPNFVLRAPSSLSKARALASKRAVLDHYFDLLEENNHLKDKPCQILIWTSPLTPSHLKLSMSKVASFLMHNCWLCKCCGPMSASNGHMESEDLET